MTEPDNPRSVTCVESDKIRPGLTPASSITNYVGGEVLNWDLPPITATTWEDDDGNEILRDERDANGCRHWVRDA